MFQYATTKRYQRLLLLGLLGLLGLGVVLGASRQGQQPQDDASYAHIAASLAAFGPPSAACFAGDPSPPRFDTVALLAMGRSGSTSLMRLLNRLPCFNVRGEGSAALLHATVPGLFEPDAMRRRMDNLRFTRRFAFWNGTVYRDPGLPGKPAHFHRWDPGRVEALLSLLESGSQASPGMPNATRLQTSRRLAAEFLEHVPGRVTTGFKEISLFTPMGSNWSASLAFMDQWAAMFPRTAVLVMTRAEDGLKRSGWWRGMDAKVTEWALKTNRGWLEDFAGLVEQGRYAAIPGSRVELVRVTYEDAVACSFAPGSSLLAAFNMLGQRPDRRACAEVMGNNMEDGGIASSWLDWGPQRAHGWTYGSRTLDSDGFLGPFEQLGDPVPVLNGTDADFSHPAVPSGAAFLRRSYSVPHELPAGQLLPCRRWTNSAHRTSASVRTTYDNPRHPGCTFSLYFPGLRDPVVLQKRNGTEEFTVELRQGLTVELCVAREGCKADGLIATVTVVRKGLAAAAAE